MDAIDNAATQLGTAVQNVLNNPDVRSGEQIHIILPCPYSILTSIFSAEYLPVLCSGRQVYGSRLRSVLKQPLVIPVLIPRPSLDIGDLQTETGTSATPALPPHLMNMLSRVKSRLIGESRDWELKCWYITGDAKWGSMDRFGDEVTELMWSLHGWFKVVSRKSVDSSESSRSSFMLWAKSCGATEVARRYRRRFILPNVPLHHPTSFARLFNGYPTLRESLLFRAWVRRCPPDSTRY